jgi:hypothetical protein
MRNKAILFVFLAACAEDTTIRSSYVDVRTYSSNLTVTNTAKDPVFVFVILEEKQTATIPAETIYHYKQKSFTLNTNTTKMFKFTNDIKLKYLRTCLIIKGKLEYCRSESF